MTNKKFPIVCPECKSTDLCEVTESIYQTTQYTYVGSKTVLYKKTGEDSENFGDLYVKCAKCGYRYDDSVYEAFQESV